jgi:V/A-type H+-transporting ATPase subunit K
VIANKAGLLSGGSAVTDTQGLMFFFAALPAAFGGLISAIHQGKVAASGIGLVAKRGEEAGKAIILTVMVETYAVLALLISFLLVNGVSVG